MKHNAWTWLALAVAGGCLAVACSGNPEDGVDFATGAGAGATASTTSGNGGTRLVGSTSSGIQNTGGTGGDGVGGSTASSPTTTNTGSTGSGGTGGSGTCPATACNLDSDCEGLCTGVVSGASACCDTSTNLCFISATATCPSSPTTTGTGTGSTTSSSSGY